MLVLLDRCCGLDIHKELIFACCLSGDSDSPTAVHSQFVTNQNGLSELCNWLKSLDCVHVAMESTGVYWRPVYEAIEDQFPDCEAIVINAQHFHNLPGRKSDVKDAEWIATMYRHGLLSKSFVPMSWDVMGTVLLTRSCSQNDTSIDPRQALDLPDGQTFFL